MKNQGLEDIFIVKCLNINISELHKLLSTQFTICISTSKVVKSLKTLNQMLEEYNLYDDVKE